MEHNEELPPRREDFPEIPVYDPIPQNYSRAIPDPDCGNLTSIGATTGQQGKSVTATFPAGAQIGAWPNIPDPQRAAGLGNRYLRRKVRLTAEVAGATNVRMWTWVQFVQGSIRMWTAQPGQADIVVRNQSSARWLFDQLDPTLPHFKHVLYGAKNATLRDRPGIEQWQFMANSFMNQRLQFLSYAVCPRTPKENQVAFGVCVWDFNVSVNGLRVSQDSSPIFCSPIVPFYLHTHPLLAGAPRAQGNLNAIGGEDNDDGDD